MERSVKFSLFLTALFLLTLMPSPVWAFSPIDNGDFTESGLSIPMKDNCASGTCVLECEFDWCGVGATASDYDGASYGWVWDSAEYSASDHNVGGSTYIYTNGLSGSFLNTFLFYSQDYYDGARTIQFFYSGLFCPDTYYVPADRCVISYGYVDSSGSFNSFVEQGTFGDTSAGWHDVNFYVPDGNYAPALRSTLDASKGIISGTGVMGFRVDSFGEEILTYASSDLNLRVDDTTTFIGDNTLFTLDFLETENGTPIENGDCDINLENVVYNMTDNGDGTWSITHNFSSVGNFDVNATCTADDTLDGTDSLNLDITYRASDVLTITDLVNTGYSIDDDDRTITFTPVSDSTFSFCSSSLVSDFDVGFDWLQNKSSQLQYFVFTSSDNESWVLNHTLTYGADTNTPVQKIPFSTSKDEYSFDYTYADVGQKCFKLQYQMPDYYAQTIKSEDEWIKQNVPSQWIDGISAEWDLYHNSLYTNIRNYSREYFSDMVSSDFNTGYQLQFTAYADTNIDLNVGYVDNGVDTTQTISLDTTPRRFSVPVDPDNFDSQFLIKSVSDDDAKIYLTYYSIIPTAYFASRIEVLNGDGSALKVILNNGESHEYVPEMIPFRVNWSVYDAIGDLNLLRVEAILEGSTIKTLEEDITYSGAGERITFSQAFEGVVDLNGYSGNPDALRNLVIRATLVNDDGDEVYEQFKTIKLLQYPHFLSDIEFYVDSLNGLVGDNPSFRLTLNQKYPDALIGIKVAIYDEDGSVNASDYNTIIWADDLDCDLYCNKNIVIDDWVYEDDKFYRASFLLLLTTEYENYDNGLTLRVEDVETGYREFETARILQVGERSDRIYRNDEPVPVVLQLRVPDGDGYRDVSDEVSAYLNINLCDANTGGTCVSQETNFYPISHVYEPSTGYNYFYFNNLFYKDNGSLINDGNRIQFEAHLVDKREHYETEINPTLVDKCKDQNYLDNFSWNPYTMVMNWAEDLANDGLKAIAGCEAGFYSSANVEVGDSEERRIYVSENHATQALQTFSLACDKADNDSYINNLKQDLVCVIIYKVSEQPINKFKVQLGNQYSDYSKTGDEAQYLEFSIPAEQIIFNDYVLIAQALNANYTTDELDTVGEVVYKGMDEIISNFGSSITPYINDASAIANTTGLLTDAGWDIDLNNAFDPNTLTGIAYIKISGVEVENMRDYYPLDEELEFLSPKEFRSYAKVKGIDVKDHSVRVSVYGFDMSEMSVLEANSPLIINESPSINNIKSSELDDNISTSVIPKTLLFNVIVDMISNNYSSNVRRFIPIRLTYIVVDKSFGIRTIQANVESFLEDLVDDPVGTADEQIQLMINSAWSNWFLIFLLGAIILVGSVAYRNFKGGGGFTLNMNQPPQAG